jgi:hypothetical protein
MPDGSPDPSVLPLVARLIAIDAEEIAAYEAAVTRMHDPDDRAQLRRFLADHNCHVAFLTAAARTLGSPITAQVDHPRRRGKMRVMLGALLGDRGIFEALGHDEDVAKRAYLLGAAERALPPQLRRVIEQNLRDELRHAAWIDQRIGQTHQRISGPAT